MCGELGGNVELKDLKRQFTKNPINKYINIVKIKSNLTKAKEIQIKK